MITQDNANKELFNLRTKYGITQEKINISTGISRVTITNIENGKLTPRATTLFKLNEYFKKLGEN